MKAIAISRGYLLPSFLFFLVLAIAGVYLRANYVTPLPGFPFRNLVHAHSHVAYFGWASLAMMGGGYYVLSRISPRLPTYSRFIKVQLYSIITLTLGTFISFSVSGYSTSSIVLSALNGMLWVTHAIVILRSYWLIQAPKPFSARALALSAAYLLISYGGTWLVVILKIAGVESGMWRNAGVYLFLHNFVDGWMIIGLMGLISAVFPELECELKGAKGDFMLLLLALMTAPGFLLWLAPDGLTHTLVVVGAIARLVVAIPYVTFLRASLRTVIHKGLVRQTKGPWPTGSAGDISAAMAAAMPFFVAAWCFFSVRVVMQVITSLWPPLLELGRTREIFIGYLHTELLGAITSALTGFIYLWVVRLPRYPILSKVHFAGYLVGTIGMILCLFSAGFSSLIPLPELMRGFLVAAFVFSSLILLSSFTVILQLRTKAG